MENSHIKYMIAILVFLLSMIIGIFSTTATFHNDENFCKKQQEYIEYLKQQNYTSTSKRNKIKRLEKMYY